MAAAAFLNIGKIAISQQRLLRLDSAFHKPLDGKISISFAAG